MVFWGAVNRKSGLSGMRICVNPIGKISRPTEILDEEEGNLEWVIKEGYNE